jgi:hypothetical protein
MQPVINMTYILEVTKQQVPLPHLWTRRFSCCRHKHTKTNSMPMNRLEGNSLPFICEQTKFPCPHSRAHIRVCRHNLNNCRSQLFSFCQRCSSWTRANDLSSFKIEQVSHFRILSHGLSLNTISKALTRALQGVNKRKNIQCCQLMFFQCSKHKLYPPIS